MSIETVSKELAKRFISGLSLEGQNVEQIAGLTERMFKEYVGVVQNHAHRNITTEVGKGTEYFSEAKEAGLEAGTAALLVNQVAQFARKYAVIIATSVPEEEQTRALFYADASFPGPILALYKPVNLPNEVTALASEERTTHLQANAKANHEQAIAGACDEVAIKVTNKYGPPENDETQKDRRAEFMQIIHDTAAQYMTLLAEKDEALKQRSRVKKYVGAVRTAVNSVRNRDEPLDEAAIEVGSATKDKLYKLDVDKKTADNVVGETLNLTGERYRSIARSRVTLVVDAVSRLRHADEELFSKTTVGVQGRTH